MNQDKEVYFKNLLKIFGITFEEEITSSFPRTKLDSDKITKEQHEKVKELYNQVYKVNDRDFFDLDVKEYDTLI